MTEAQTISYLLDQSAEARQKNDWIKLEKLSIEIFQILYKKPNVDELSLKSLVQNYLSSIIGTGEFLIELKSADVKKYKEGLSKLEKFLMKKRYRFSTVPPIVNSAREIALLALEPTAANKNKISKHLRRIARPDIAIVLCNQALAISRTNYYSLTVLCGAYCDLNRFDEAITAAQTALKWSPEAMKIYPLTALVRVHTEKFKTNGDLAEIQQALKYGHRAIDIRLDSYIANAFIAAAMASADQSQIEYAKDVLEQAAPQESEIDIAALFQAYASSRALSPDAETERVFDEVDEDLKILASDSLVNLVVREMGFSPVILDLRKMPERFNSQGWFLQGSSRIECPQCGNAGLYSYRKHFKRFGKTLHYWGIVCVNCKSATDSIDYDNKLWQLIATDFEERYPVCNLCNLCS